MNDLRSFVALQARLYDFLEKQDDAILQGIVNGTVQLAILTNGDAPARVSAATRDPYEAVPELPNLTSVQERRKYLNATGLTVKQLRDVAQRLRLKRYSGLAKAKLIDLLAGHGLDETDTLADEPRSPGPAPLEPLEDGSAGDRQADTAEARPAPTARSTDTAKQNVDAAAVASRLRELETEEEGAEYLRTQRLDREGLLAVAAELQLTRVARLKASELEKRVLKQAIGARRKFAGLRKW
jgi:hypothetical protein